MKAIAWLLVFFWFSMLVADDVVTTDKDKKAQQATETQDEKPKFGYDLAGKFGPGLGFVEAKGYKSGTSFSVNVEMAHRVYWGDRDKSQIGIAPHMAYAMKGHAFSSNGDHVVHNYHYLEIDILSGYFSFFAKSLDIGLNAMFGFPFAFLLDAEQTLGGITINIKDIIEPFDLCAYGSIGFEYSFGKYGKITFDLRFETGLLDIYKDSSNYAFTNYNIFFNIGYVYNVLSW